MISETFDKLDVAVTDMNKKKDLYDQAEAATAKAYADYQDAFKIADGIRGQLASQLGSIIPSEPVTRARIN